MTKNELESKTTDELHAILIELQGNRFFWMNNQLSLKENLISKILLY